MYGKKKIVMEIVDINVMEIRPDKCISTLVRILDLPYKTYLAKDSAVFKKCQKSVLLGGPMQFVARENSRLS